MRNARSGIRESPEILTLTENSQSISLKAIYRICGSAAPPHCTWNLSEPLQRPVWTRHRRWFGCPGSVDRSRSGLMALSSGPALLTKPMVPDSNGGAFGTSLLGSLFVPFWFRLVEPIDRAGSGEDGLAGSPIQAKPVRRGEWGSQCLEGEGRHLPRLSQRRQRLVGVSSQLADTPLSGVSSAAPPDGTAVWPLATEVSVRGSTWRLRPVLWRTRRGRPGWWRGRSVQGAVALRVAMLRCR